MAIYKCSTGPLGPFWTPGASTKKIAKFGLKDRITPHLHNFTRRRSGQLVVGGLQLVGGSWLVAVCGWKFVGGN